MCQCGSPGLCPSCKFLKVKIVRKDMMLMRRLVMMMLMRRMVMMVLMRRMVMILPMRRMVMMMLMRVCGGFTYRYFLRISVIIIIMLRLMISSFMRIIQMER